MTVVNYKIQLKPIYQLDFQQDEQSDKNFELRKLINRRVRNQLNRVDYTSFMELVDDNTRSLAMSLSMNSNDVEVINSIVGSELNGGSLWIEGMLAFRVNDDSVVDIDENESQILVESWYQFMFSNWLVNSSYIKEIEEWNYNIIWSMQLATAIEYSDVKWTHEV